MTTRSPLARALSFALAHHVEAELHRCLRVGPLHLCARCLGMYAAMLASWFPQELLGAPREVLVDPLWIFLLPWPAFADWARGQYDPATGTNGIRLLTGALLGVSLGRVAFLLHHHPDDLRSPILLLVLALMAAAVVVRARRYRAEVGP